ncbi:MAG: DnaJ domain-containing protein [Oligoflexia bacterium]|nr:DnaJ domain-containing protein [Oligoflexia bacterium]
MDKTLAVRVEIETLHGLLPELDYYKILRLDSDSSQDAIGPAFRSESRRMHPDRYSALGDQSLLSMVNDISRLVREAYSTLNDPEKRAVYDDELVNGVARMSNDALARADQQRAATHDPAEAATNEKAGKYWKMALKDIEEKNFKGAVMNIQFALTFEPDNDTFKEYLKQAKSDAEEHKKKNFNPYKLRIV